MRNNSQGIKSHTKTADIIKKNWEDTTKLTISVEMGDKNFVNTNTFMLNV